MVFGAETDEGMALAQFECDADSDPKAFVLDTIGELLRALQEPTVDIKLADIASEE